MSNVKTSAVITSVGTNNKVVSKAITDINPAADNAAIKTLCQSLNSLTTNTFTGAQRIDKTDITAATTKPKLTLEVDSTELAKLAVTSEGTSAEFAHAPLGFKISNLELHTAGYIWEDNGANYVFDPTAPTSRYVMGGYVSKTTFGAACRFVEEGNHTLDESSIVTVNFYFSETNTTAATQYRLTITKTAGQATFVQL